MTMADVVILEDVAGKMCDQLQRLNNLNPQGEPLRCRQAVRVAGVVALAMDLAREAADALRVKIAEQDSLDMCTEAATAEGASVAKTPCAYCGMTFRDMRAHPAGDGRLCHGDCLAAYEGTFQDGDVRIK